MNNLDTNLEPHPAESSQPATSASREPNDQQAKAIENVLEFVQDPDPGHNMAILSGGAGTGKTFCVQHVRERIRGSRVKFAYTAPTNKAAKELRKMSGEAGTIFSLLGLRIDKSGELKELVAGERPDLSDVDVILIDEGSMVNKNLMSHLKIVCNDGRMKVLFLGDNAQLPPVGEDSSPIWKEPGVPQWTLEKVMRHDNQILQLATHVRQQVFSLQSALRLTSSNDGNEGVWKQTKAQFKMDLYNRAQNGEFSDGNANKIIAWRNVRTGEYNDLVRQGIYGGEAQPGFYLPGDRIIAAGPCRMGEEIILATDEEASVVSVREANHPGESKYKMLELKCLTEDGRNIRVWAMHPASAPQFARDCEDLAHAARTDGRLWRKFWALKDIFHEIKYAYAITAHRAQGSTYTNVFVDSGDILLNRNRREALQCLYVACSRPTTRLYLA